MKTKRSTKNTKVKIVPLKAPTQEELDNSTSKGTRVLTYEESMER
jgi:hypothetical protein